MVHAVSSAANDADGNAHGSITQRKNEFDE